MEAKQITASGEGADCNVEYRQRMFVHGEHRRLGGAGQGWNLNCAPGEVTLMFEARCNSKNAANGDSSESST